MIEEVTASTHGRNVLAVTAAAAEEVAEFIVFSAKSIGCILLEPAHASDPSFDSAMVLLKSIVQVHIRPVTDIAA